MTAPHIPFIPTVGLTVTVRRATGGDSTRHGVSSRHTTLTVVGVIDDRTLTIREQVSGHAATPMPLTDGDPLQDQDPDGAVYLRIRRGRTAAVGLLYSLEPVGEPRPWFMFGGNTVASADPRLLVLTGGAACLNIHDRVEA
jgi:hypothetical protein